MSPSNDKPTYTTPAKAVALSQVGTMVTNPRTHKVEFRASFLIHWRPNATSHHDNNAIAYSI